MYKHTPPADSIERKKYKNSLNILTQNETIAFYIFEAKKKAVCWSMYKHTPADSIEKSQKIVEYFDPK